MTLTNVQRRFLWKKCWPVKVARIITWTSGIGVLTVFVCMMFYSIGRDTTEPTIALALGPFLLIFLFIYLRSNCYVLDFEQKPRYRIPLLWVQCNKSIDDYPVDATEYRWWKFHFENNLMLCATEFLENCHRQEAWDKLIKAIKQAMEQFEASAQIVEGTSLLTDLRKTRCQWNKMLKVYIDSGIRISNNVGTAKANLEREWELAELLGIAPPTKNLKTFLEKVKPTTLSDSEILRRVINTAEIYAGGYGELDFNPRKILTGIELTAN